MDYNKYRGLTLYQAFSKNAKESADEPCTIFKNKVFKYEYVAFRIEQTAHLLKKHGACGGGDIITIVLPNIPQTEYIIYGANKIGAIVHLIHPLSTKEQLIDNITKTGSNYIFVLDRFASNYFEVLKDKKIKIFTVSPFGELGLFKNFIYKRISRIKSHPEVIDFDSELRLCKVFEKANCAEKDAKET
ncbi:MAG: AMP-binding protein, partial [Christensenellaceae bacterium]|nr:AMP-binding protein [Christensenellaceae bacterium]